MADASAAAETVPDDHPLAIELVSLRTAVSRYQHEAHATSLKLQRHSLEASQALDHARALERENAWLKEEVAVLRANPDDSPTQASFQVPELTLALRRLSEKHTALEDMLHARTKELADVRSELANAQHETEAARSLAADARAREEEGLARERELERKLKAAEEERRMADLVVQEYAALVRKLEGRAKAPSETSSVSSVDLQRTSTTSSPTLASGLAEGRSGLQRLLEEFNGQNERLEAEIAKLHGDNGLLYKELEVARLAAEHDRAELAKAKHELDKYRADDSTAAKMVSRYMKFSQSATDTLQKAMDALRARHAATLASLNAEVAHLQDALEQERSESDRLRSALDELTEDIAREAYGRRREVSVRLAFLGREENLAENLRRWIRRARESLERSSGDSGDGELNAIVLREAFARSVLDAEGLLDTLNGQPSHDGDGSLNGSIARLILAQDAVSSLMHELQEETVRRLKTERKLARLETLEHPNGVPVRQAPEPLVQPVPQRASIGGPAKPLLADKSASTSDVASPSPLQAPEPSVEEASAVGISIENIVITPSLDRSSQHPSGVDCNTQSPASNEGESRFTSSNEPPRPTSPTPPVPQIHTDEPRNDPAPASIHISTSAAPDIPVPVATHSYDTPAVPFPSGAISVDTQPESEPSPGTVSPSPSPPTSYEPSGISPPPAQTPVPESSLRARDATVPPPLQLDATNGSALSSLPSSPPSAPPSSEDKQATLLASLARVKHRYDDVQRGFRNCHLALRELKKSLTDLPSPATPSDMLSLLRKAMERLSDFNEDARVELEIRIADEERIASGYEALLSIPGALSHSEDGADIDASRMLKEVGAFVDGSDRAVSKATQSFAHKLDDLEHDIASIKRTLHELALASPEDALSTGTPPARTSPSWSAWTPNFLSPPRAASPAPTFGSVVTSPRLRHASSFSSHPREPSGSGDPAHDPLASLGLRIAVPSPVPSSTYGGLGPGPASGVGGPQRPGSRQRTTSGMFMLGLGMRSSSFGSSLNVHASAGASKTSLGSTGANASTSRLANVSPRKDESSDDEVGDVDSDIE
ncbi:hypothetical protein BD413DRAFT_463703 [Trametes elegans]|nr:hypothetical protein BD413DRAFT_463703 [Trametes elegans]